MCAWVPLLALWLIVQGRLVRAGHKPAPQQQRLFDKELDNQHEEPLLLAQLAAEQLRTLLLQDGADDAVSRRVVVEWAAGLAQVCLYFSPCQSSMVRATAAVEQPQCTVRSCAGPEHW